MPVTDSTALDITEVIVNRYHFGVSGKTVLSIVKAVLEEVEERHLIADKIHKALVASSDGA